MGLIGRMLERATENAVTPPGPEPGNVVTGRFSRDAAEFATGEGAGA